ncbi:MAG: hypothetical protein R3F43_20235 [bacterium]
MPLTAEMAAFLDTPGFLDFYKFVFKLGVVAEHEVHWTDLDAVKSADQLRTIGQFDALMRAAGL